jgi:hypothetical protein
MELQSQLEYSLLVKATHLEPMDGTTVGSPRYSSPLFELPRPNTSGSPPPCSLQHAGWGPLLISSKRTSCQGDCINHFPKPRARRCLSPTDRVSSRESMTVFYNSSADRGLPTKHDRPVSGSGLANSRLARLASMSAPDLISFEKMATETRSERGPVIIIVKGHTKVPFLARGLTRAKHLPGRVTREPSPTRVPSTKHTKLAHITICRSGTF